MTKLPRKEPRLSLFAGAPTQGARLARAAPARPARPSRAKRVAGPASLVPGDHVDAAVRVRLHEEVEAQLLRRSPTEARVAGALRALAPASPALRSELHRVATVLLERDALQRELWCCAVRSLGEHEPAAAAPILERALGREEGGGVATLTAAALSTAPGLGAPLAKLASGGRSLVAFAAEVGRSLRGESSGAHLLHLAPIIKEAHRVALATGVVLPLVHALAARGAGPSGGEALAPGFEILRSAERHLGRWLSFAEAVVWAGDPGPLRDARARAESGPESARCAWGLLAWALADAAALAGGHERPPPPDARLTAEVAARLSDRPSAERDSPFCSGSPRDERPARASCSTPSAAALSSTRRRSAPRRSSRATSGAPTCCPSSAPALSPGRTASAGSPWAPSGTRGTKLPRSSWPASSSRRSTSARWPGRRA